MKFYRNYGRWARAKRRGLVLRLTPADLLWLFPLFGVVLLIGYNLGLKGGM